MDQQTLFLTILGMAGVTALPRMLPALLFASRPLPLWLRRWLSVVPAAVLGALLAQSVLLRGGAFDPGLGNPFLWGALLTGLLAWRTRGFFGPVLAGMALVALWRWLLP